MHFLLKYLIATNLNLNSAFLPAYSDVKFNFFFKNNFKFQFCQTIIFALKLVKKSLGNLLFLFRILKT